MFLRWALALLISISAVHAAEWQKLDGCKLVLNSYRDGDSFHVTTGNKDYIFRLYFVDCPESDDRFKDRVAEQAAYFGISHADGLQLGKTAEEFTAKALAQPFTVLTKFQDARGASAQHRFYAMIETPAGSLASLLVANGFARVFGMPTALPNGGSSADFIAQLKGLEAQAKEAKRGGWGGGTGGTVTVPLGPESDDQAASSSDIPAF